MTVLYLQQQQQQQQQQHLCAQDRQYTFNEILRGVRVTFLPSKKISITYSECVSIASVIQNTTRMRRFISWTVACPAVPHFSTLSHKGHVFRKKKVLNTKYVLIFSKIFFSDIFLILRRTERNMNINVYWSTCKYQLFLLYFKEIWIFLADFRKIMKYKFSWKSFQLEPCCSMRTDRQTWGR